jgi:hypothetical protein
MIKKLLIALLMVCMVLMLAACPADADESNGNGDDSEVLSNPCDEVCEMHTESGECHCHGQCGVEGCACHGAH